MNTEIQEQIEFYALQVIAWQTLQLENKAIEANLFRLMIQEITKIEFFKESEIIAMYKLKNKIWKRLAKRFHEIIHTKSFKNNVQRNVYAHAFTWRWWFK